MQYLNQWTQTHLKQNLAEQQFNFREGKYRTLEQVERDLLLIVENCQYYNGNNHSLYKLSISFKKAVQTQIVQILGKYNRENLNHYYEFNIDQKELDACDKRCFDATIQTFMDNPQYYDQLSHLENESEQIVKWLTDFLSLKTFNQSTFDKIVFMYKGGKFKTMNDIYLYIRNHLDVTCHREFQTHFSSLMNCLIRIRELKQEEQEQKKPKQQRPNIFTIKIKVPKKKIQPQQRPNIITIKIKIKKSKKQI